MSDILDDEEGGTSRRFMDVARLKSDLRTYYLLLAVLLVVFLTAGVSILVLTPPVYTATAIVGPADNSDQPFGLDAAGAGGGVGGIAKHLHVGGLLGQTGDDTFNEYTSLLTSTRLAWVLVSKDHILPEMYPLRWDAANKRWYPRDTLYDRVADVAKAMLRRPVKPGPDVDDLVKSFDTKLTVDISLETSFATVTFKSGSPTGAERILNLILQEADNIIRQDKKRDVSARIGYLNSALENLTNADQKPAMIDILSEQQQEMMMVAADHRYASVLIDPPHSPLVPTSPVPVLYAAIAFVLACIAWLGAVRLTPPAGRRRWLLESFARPRARHAQSHSGIGVKAGSPASSR
jgi:hypothetical protein